MLWWVLTSFLLNDVHPTNDANPPKCPTKQSPHDRFERCRRRLVLADAQLALFHLNVDLAFVGDDDRVCRVKDAPYHKGECINNVTVSGIHDEHGIFFTLDAKNSGLYRKRVMQEMEWTMREALYTVGNKMDVVVVGVKKKGKNGWNIEVKPIET